MKEQNGKLSRDEFLSFVKAVLKKKSLEENKPLYFEYRLSENGEKEKFLNRFDAFAPEGFSEYRNSVIFEFIYSRTLKAEQIKKRIKGVTDTYRKSYDATIVFILNTEFQFEDSNSAVWDLSVINNWIEEYPTEYSHACSLGMERKTVASDKENIQLFEKLYQNAGRIVTTGILCETICGEFWQGYESTLSTHIRHLREKIEENPSKPVSLVTVKGLGYRLNLKEVSP